MIHTHTHSTPFPRKPPIMSSEISVNVSSLCHTSSTLSSLAFACLARSAIPLITQWRRFRNRRGRLRSSLVRIRKSAREGSHPSRKLSSDLARPNVDPMLHFGPARRHGNACPHLRAAPGPGCRVQPPSPLCTGYFSLFWYFYGVCTDMGMKC